jgi:hypothetical protein
MSAFGYKADITVAIAKPLAQEKNQQISISGQGFYKALVAHSMHVHIDSILRIRSMANSYSQFFPLVGVIALVSPVVASGCAVVFYALHCNVLPNPEDRVSLLVYVLVLFVCAVIAFFFGLEYGVKWACSSPSGGNLCGLAGFLIGGPIAASLAIFFAAALMAFSGR